MVLFANSWPHKVGISTEEEGVARKVENLNVLQGYTTRPKQF